MMKYSYLQINEDTSFQNFVPISQTLNVADFSGFSPQHVDHHKCYQLSVTVIHDIERFHDTERYEVHL